MLNHLPLCVHVHEELPARYSEDDTCDAAQVSPLQNLGNPAAGSICLAVADMNRSARQAERVAQCEVDSKQKPSEHLC